MSALAEQIAQQLDEDIPGAFALTGGFVTKWVMIAEAVDPAGERVLWTHTSTDLQPWELLGLLKFVMLREESGCTHVCDEDDEEGLAGA